MLLPLFAAAFAGAPGPAVHVGDPALLFSLPAINEDAALHAVARTAVSLSDYTGVMPGFPAKAVVVHFMRREGGDTQLAAMQRLDKKYGSRGIRTLAVLSGPGDIATISAWVESQHLDFPVLRDAHDIVVARYGVKQFPTTVVVDSDGDVLALGIPKTDLESSLDTVLGAIAPR